MTEQEYMEKVLYNIKRAYKAEGISVNFAAITVDFIKGYDTKNSEWILSIHPDLEEVYFWQPPKWVLDRKFEDYENV